jgi:hypothetical protein
MSNSNKSADRIVANGGWTVEKRDPQPKAPLFRILTILWIFPSAGAVVVLSMGWRRWFDADGILEGLRNVPFEHWIAFGLLLAHPIFAGLAWRSRRTDSLKERTVLVPNPAHDPRKLY